MCIVTACAAFDDVDLGNITGQRSIKVHRCMFCCKINPCEVALSSNSESKRLNLCRYKSFSKYLSDSCHLNKKKHKIRNLNYILYIMLQGVNLSKGNISNRNYSKDVS